MPGIILFDGVCNVCSKSVQFILKRDPSRHFQFASLQGDRGQELLRKSGIGPETDSIVLIENDISYIKSDAVLRICRHLQGPVRMLYPLRFIPKRVRDWVYDRIALNRYSWFGKKDRCKIPSKEERDRFLD
ncbi:thiol-disulfide oxidoreductase DCC family protein [Bacillus marinisedimentorum]|uniref:thiol-disulfide oxidoreductase DCC family protein n=1 Tax=Bacillus marinisedimentorum TaxID=1821260 RepID=UPI0007E12710|nr:thiol-disulfide oxidoreductase DCC family protein [Bacillus marinisedimentorum]